ncbi:MAG: hypothetical protein Q9169_004001 [Polycauliona sp. 2 TL-2023]
MKSLDDLVRFLLEEIALCGDHGASTTDFIQFVKVYYSIDTNNGDGIASTGKPNTLVDQKLLEKVWRWLARHPEIQVGKDPKFKRLSLPEVEHLNTFKSSVENVDKASSTPTQFQPQKQAESLTSHGAKQHGNVIVENDETSCESHVELRVYVSTERRWVALTGHGYDPDRVPRLDFACLSVIAAHREQGILQPDLVRISGQDKRSVPQRTQRLHDAGHILKIPLLVNRAHTSRLMLKRYASQGVARDNDAEGADDQSALFQSARNSIENPTDLVAMHHAIFKLLRERQLITTVELQHKIVSRFVLTQSLRTYSRSGCYWA